MIKYDAIKTDQRQAQFFRIIEALNDMESNTGGLFDCGDLGFCHIWVGRLGHWECQWFDKPLTLNDLID